MALFCTDTFLDTHGDETDKKTSLSADPIGVAAPMIVVAGRLLQGLSAGVELGGVSVYLAEIAPPGRKGFYVAWQSASQQIAVVFAAFIGIVANSFLSPDEMTGWGWRIPFFIGCLMIPFLVLIRRTLEETPAFLARKEQATLKQIFRTVATNWGLVTRGALVAVMHVNNEIGVIQPVADIAAHAHRADADLFTHGLAGDQRSRRRDRKLIEVGGAFGGAERCENPACPRRGRHARCSR